MSNALAGRRTGRRNAPTLMAKRAFAFATPLAFAFALTFGAMAASSGRHGGQFPAVGVSHPLNPLVAWWATLHAAFHPNNPDVLLDGFRDEVVDDWVTSASLEEGEAVGVGGRSPKLGYLDWRLALVPVATRA